MATILPFPDFVSQSIRSGAASRRRASAEIIIFPGIRVEYWDDAAAKSKAQKSARKRRKHRDVLELMD